MKERPILFSAPMVRALLAGTKTQTRRVCKPAQFYSLSHVVEVPDPQERGQVYNGSHFGDEEGDVHFASPYGGRGDRLWVRETWYCDDYRVQRGPYLKPADMDIEEARSDGTLIYRASSGDRPYETEQPVWRPAIHMPRWASRITLEVTGVRVERLQDISEADSIAEGTPCYVCGGPLTGHSEDDCHCFHRSAQPSDYRALWEQINGPESWAANPWVWCVAFRRLEAAC